MTGSAPAAGPAAPAAGPASPAAGPAIPAAGPAIPAAGPAAPSGLAQLPYAIVLVGVAGALATIRLGGHHVASGTLVLAGVLLIAALVRLVLPDRQAGMLSSRRRLLDVATFAVLGLGLVAAGLLVSAPT